MKRMLMVFFVFGLLSSWSLVMAGDLFVIPAKKHTSWDKKMPVATRFKLVLDGEAVLDRETGLVWERTLCSTSSPTGYCEHDWSEACLECYKKKLGGRMGWRLPAVEELTSLVDTLRVDPALPQDHPFDFVRSSRYWSSTSYPGVGNHALCVDLNTGSVPPQLKTTAGPYTWCVHGGHGHDGH